MQIQKTSKELEVERPAGVEASGGHEPGAGDCAKWISRKARWTTWKTQQNATNNGRMSFSVVITLDGHSHDID